MQTMQKSLITKLFLRTVFCGIICYLFPLLSYKLNLPYLDFSVWATSGVALAFMLAYGAQMGWGVLLGILFFLISHPIEAPTLFSAALIAGGLTLQSLTGIWLIKRVSQVVPPATVIDTVKIIFITVVFSSFGAFFQALVVPADQYTFLIFIDQFLEHWFASFIGLNLIAPALFMLLSIPQKAMVVRHALKWVVASLLVGFTVYIFFMVKETALNNKENWFHWAVLLVGFLALSAFLGYVESRQKTELALEKSEALLRSLADNAPIGIFRADSDWVVRYANQALTNIFGYSSSEYLTGKKFGLFPVSQAALLEAQKEFQAHQTHYHRQVDVKTSTGEIRHVLLSISADQAAFNGSLIDITDQARSGREFQQLSHIVTQMADTVVITDLHGTIEYVNPAFEMLSGFTREEVVGKKPNILKSGMHKDEFYKSLWETIVSGHIYHGEIINRKKNGELYYETKTISPVRNSAGAITHFVATGKDNTDRRMAERDLLNSKRQLEATLNALPDLLFELDEEYHIVDYRAQNQDLLLIKNKNFIGQSIDQILPEEARITVKTSLAMAAKYGRHFGSTYSLPMPEGTRWFELSISTKLNPEDNSQNYIVLVHDVTDRQQAQRLQEVLYHIAEAAHNAASLQELYPQIQEEVQQVMYAENMYIALYHKSTNKLNFVFSQDEITNYELGLYPADDGLTSYIIHSGRSLLFKDGDPYPSGVTNIGEPAAIWLGVPLKINGEVIGALAIQHYSNSDIYTEREQRMLEFVSTQVATAIERKRVEENQRKDQQRLEHQYQLIEILNASSTRLINLPVEQIDAEIESVLKQLGTLENVDRAYVFQFEEDRTLMNNTHEWCAEGISPEIDNLKGIPIDVYPWWMEKMQHGEAVHIPSVALLPVEAQTEREALEPQGIQSLLALPLVSNAGLFGFIGFDAVMQARHWDTDTVLLFKTMADVFSNALIRRKAGLALHASEDKFSKVFQSSPDSIVISDTNSKQIVDVNESFVRTTGYNREEVIGRTAQDLGLWVDLKKRELFVFNVDSGRSVKNIEARFKLKSGEIRLGLVAGEVLELKSGEKRVLSVIRDITEQKLVEQALFESQERYRGLLSSLDNVIASVDYDGRFLYVNEQAANQLNFSVESLLGKNMFEIFPRPVAEAQLENVRKVIEKDKPYISEGITPTREGSRWYRTSIHPVHDLHGNVAYALINATDIHNLKTAQAELQALNQSLEQRVQERTSEVRQSEATYRALFENSNDGIFLISPEGKNLNANQEALDMLGYTLSEFQALPNNSLLMASVPEQQADSDARFAAALRGEYVPLYERTFIGKEGKLIDVEINLSPVRNPLGQVIMLQSVVRDITDRKKAEEVLRESRDKLSVANASLERASRMKDEFLASMSHELRTPLTGILGLSESLALQTYGSLNEKQLRALTTIETSGRHLLELINDILDLSKIEAGKLDMQFEMCNISEVCQASLQLVKGMAHQKQHKVSFSISPASIMIRSDPRRLKQMLVNLLSNAVKFTGNGGELGLIVQAQEDEKRVALTVWDKGIGIKQEDLPKLFKPFQQLDSSLARQYSGTGLGLSLVQRMAELHGGSVQVESTPSEGSIFTLFLPYQPQTTTSSAVEETLRPNITNAFVIEDNAVDAEHASLYLSRLGITTIVQPTLQGALEKAAILQPGTILLDLHLPDGSGLKLLTQLKSDERTREIPVIVCSAEERQSEARQAGAIGYLQKPYTQQELRKELQKAAQASQPRNPILVVGNSIRAPIVLMADDNEIILNTLGDYLSEVGYTFIAARSGYEILERAPDIHPDIMLVDIQMPSMDGMETIRRLRAHPDPLIANAPIIAVTALAMSGDREKCLAAGANDYISKPVSLQKLDARLRELIATLKHT